jgi:hypothetical protein
MHCVSGHYTASPLLPHCRSDLNGRPYSYVYEHFAEPRHATEAITATAEGFIRQHAQRNEAGIVSFLCCCVELGVYGMNL